MRSHTGTILKISFPDKSKISGDIKIPDGYHKSFNFLQTINWSLLVVFQGIVIYFSCCLFKYNKQQEKYIIIPWNTTKID